MQYRINAVLVHLILIWKPPQKHSLGIHRIARISHNTINTILTRMTRTRTLNIGILTLSFNHDVRANKIKNLLGLLKMCRCDVVLYCYSIAVLWFYLLSSNVVILYLICSAIVPQCYWATVLWYWSAMDLQCYGAAMLWCCSALDLQFYGAAVVLCCSAMVLKCYDLWTCSAMNMQCYGAAVLWICNAMVLQGFGSAVLWCCSAIVLQCYRSAVLLSSFCLDKQCIWVYELWV